MHSNRDGFLKAGTSRLWAWLALHAKWDYNAPSKQGSGIRFVLGHPLSEEKRATKVFTRIGRWRWSAAPASVTAVQRKNFQNVQIDAIGVGLASAAAPFLPVYLTRLGATNLQVSLLTMMPAFTGLLFSLVAGRFLEGRRNVVPWFSLARLFVISSYALTGILTALVPLGYAVETVLFVWALATIPQTLVAISFSVVMNAVAGSEGRYALMSRRWSILGLTASITTMAVGQFLNLVDFPLNYQLVFVGLAVGGLVSYYFSSHIAIPDTARVPRTVGLTAPQRLKGQMERIRNEKPFVSFVSKRFVFLSGVSFSAPLFPIYFVREAQLTDGWIGVISSVQTAVLLVGYILWARYGRRRGSRFVLVRTTLGLALYPALVATTDVPVMIAVFAGLAGIFQAGLDLVFFDELMKTVPEGQSATFVSVAQSVAYFSALVMPLLSTLVARQIGVAGALVVSSLIRGLGFALFTMDGGGWRSRVRSFRVDVFRRSAGS
jgi:MFS family permease